MQSEPEAVTVSVPFIIIFFYEHVSCVSYQNNVKNNNKNVRQKC